MPFAMAYRQRLPVEPHEHEGRCLLMKELMSAKETALMLGCSIAAIRKWASQGRLNRVKVGRLARFRRQEIEKIADNGLPSGHRAGPRTTRSA
jgi:excisionase family DNA binding protein